MLGAGGTIAPAIVRDLAASDEVDEPLLLDLDPARAQGVATLLGVGSAPGKTNLMAKVAVDALHSGEASADGAAAPTDSVHVFAAGRDLDPPPGFSVPYALQTLLDELKPPSGQTVSVHMAEASTGGRQVRVRAVTEPMEEWGLGGGIVSTAAPAAAAIRVIARGEVDARGALPPERSIEPDAMFAELERRGCRFEVTAPQEVRT